MNHTIQTNSTNTGQLPIQQAIPLPTEYRPGDNPIQTLISPTIQKPPLNQGAANSELPNITTATSNPSTTNNKIPQHRQATLLHQATLLPFNTMPSQQPIQQTQPTPSPTTTGLEQTSTQETTLTPTRTTKSIELNSTTQATLLPNNHQPGHNTTTNNPPTTEHTTIGQQQQAPLLPMNHRPGRNPLRQTQDIDLHASYGDSHYERSPNTIRIFFQNVKGLTYTTTGEDYAYYLSCTAELGADIVGMAETNSAWEHFHIRNTFSTIARKQFSLHKVNYSSPTTEIDPIPVNESFQAGGTLTLATNNLVPMALGEKHSDKSGLGRWSAISFRGKEEKLFTVITAYRVCKGNIQSSSIGSAYSREYVHHRTKAKNPNPRTIFIQDITKTIQTLQTAGHALLIMMDSNGSLDDDSELQNLLKECDLTDLHHATPAPSTYIGSNQRRIDHILGCHHTTTALIASGSLSYLDGPQSDHRGLFVDLDLQHLLKQSTVGSTITKASMRNLKSGNPESVEAYNRAVLHYYQEHKMEHRIDKLYLATNKLSTATIKKHLEKWDADQGRAMKYAEDILARPKKPYQWSPKLRNAGLLYRYWHLRLREKMRSDNYYATFQRIEQQTQQHDPTFILPFRGVPLPLTEIQTQLKSAKQHLQLSQKNAVDLRYRCYTDLLATYDNDTNPSTKKESQRKAKIVTTTIKSEQTRAMYANIRTTVKSNPSGSLKRLLVPHSIHDTTLPDNFQEFLAETPDNEIKWDSVLDQQSIDANLLRFNRQHFCAAAASPCGNGSIHEKLTYSSLGPAAAALLKGHLPQAWYGDDDLLREFLTSFIIPKHIQKLPPIPTLISTEDVCKGFSTWKETTSTSPSGRHLGHYKALIQEPILLKCLTQFLNIIISKGLTMRRWCNAVNIMIEKDIGQPKLTRLRIIHLFEADLNFFLKLQWGSRLVRRADKHNLLHSGQHGSSPRRTAMDPIMLTQLTTDLSRLLKHNLARFDNDASACYDRIIVALGMLAARRCGMPANSVNTHASSLQFMKYTVKTVFGISEDNYHGTIFEPLFGTGQGSGASPAVWLTLVVLLMNTLDRVIPWRMRFSSPDSDTKHSRLIDAFVDDTSLGFTDEGQLSLETITTQLTELAQTWEKLLFYSGGALNLSKCSWYIMYWDWKKGRPQLRPTQPQDGTVALTTQGNDQSTPTPILRNDIDKATRILGVYLSPDGDFKTQIKILKKKADQFASRLRSPRLSPQDIHTFHRTTYGPSMKYILPALAVDEEELSVIQSKILSAILNKLGHHSKLPTEIRHGPIEMGGLALIDLRTEIGISRLKYMRDAIYTNSEPGKLIIMNLKYSQMEAGIAEPLLEHPHIHISYLTPTWTTSLRQYLYLHNMTVTLTDTITINLRGKFDQCIMTPALLQKYTPSQQLDLNLVRLFLQVITLSDMSDPDGLNACPQHILGRRRTNQIIKRATWPRQTEVTGAQTKLWTNFIASNFLRYGTKWRQSPIDTNTSESSENPSPTTYPTLRQYIATLPAWYRRLLHHFEQLSSDLIIWRTFRSRQRMIIASDGSLLPTAGTFGWKITTSKHISLYHGSGPIDGPIDTGSSTRSELGGFTAPLLLITLLARHWGLRHRCKFRWLVDSKIAINRVTFIVSKDHRPKKQPDHSDYLTVIRDLHKELRRPLKSQWIKAHQDEKTTYEKLSADAKLNVDADKLATDAHHRRPKPTPTPAHIPSTQISITINKHRYASNIDANIRFQINGGYLRRYLQTKHKWTDKTWNNIDIPALGRFLKSLSLAHHTSHLKFVHDKQPLGETLLRQAKVPNPAIALCPCCLQAPEDQYHFLHCASNTARTTAVTELMKELKDSENHPFGITIASSLDRYLRHPTEPVEIPYEKLELRYHDAILQSLQDQQQIGWIHLLRGFVSLSWLHLASIKILDSKKSDSRRGAHRIHKLLQALHKFTRAVWLGRNEALHSIQETKEAIKFTAESSEIRHYFANPTLLPAEDRHYCTNNLENILRSRPSVRRRWLQRVRTARNNMLRQGQSQTPLTNYYTRETANTVTDRQHTNPQTRSDTGTTNLRTKTTQQRMTSFFPGRPPDSNATQPGNPLPI
jgi:hypothetical protein